MWHSSFRSGLLALSFLVLAACEKQTAPNHESESESPELLLHVKSPDWREQIIYFLMIDRFADGEPENNDQGANEYNPKLESHFNGGDLQGIIDNLDYIQNLGATAVWLTPPVANQWWSSAVNYGGYHGYWAVDFSQVDPHFGDLQTYQQLSHQIHQRNMYLIQDIVVNHTGNFFGYQGEYHPEDTATNFVLLEPKEGIQPHPTQKPFDQINRLDPAHAAASIYNWTPPIKDFTIDWQQHTYQLGRLADINTRNPVVLDKFKSIYSEWITKVGVDAYRIDTVRYVDHDFFHHFMHDDDGILAAARSAGRTDFLAFGEVFETSKPFGNEGEKSVTSYLGTSGRPELNSVISFPLHHELKTVFGQGQPTAQLAYRLEQHLGIYPEPGVLPIFIDNHDMPRFLASGDVRGLKQALATLFTIPGIPVIYQGTEQIMNVTRQAMFKGGYLAEKDYFEQSSEMYQFIAALARLRLSDKIFTHGSMEIVAANSVAPGLLAYKRSFQGRDVVVMLNTAQHRILIDKLALAATKGAKLAPIFGQLNQAIALADDGSITYPMEARSILIAEILKGGDAAALAKVSAIVWNAKAPQAEVTQDISFTGTSIWPDSELIVIKNGNLDKGAIVKTDSEGAWHYKYPVRNLGKEQVSLKAFSAIHQSTSDALEFTTWVKHPEFSTKILDPAGDDKGLQQNYVGMLHEQSIGQMDLVAASAKASGENLLLAITMRELTDDWMPANGFDNVAFSIFFDLPGGQGTKPLPLLNAFMPKDWQWSLGHVAYGWGNTSFSSEGASATMQGKKFGVAPEPKVDKANKTVTFKYAGADYGINNWSGAKIYITTWDISGEGEYREIKPEAENWVFGGGHHNSPKILDAIELEFNRSQSN